MKKLGLLLGVLFVMLFAVNNYSSGEEPTGTEMKQTTEETKAEAKKSCDKMKQEGKKAVEEKQEQVGEAPEKPMAPEKMAE